MAKTEKHIRKIRVYIEKGGNIYPFCWIEFLKDKSLSVGFSSKNIKLSELGTAIRKGGQFTKHLPNSFPRGILKITESNAPHITFHPPNLNEEKGAIHIVEGGKRIDEWKANWFSKGKPQHILSIISGDITILGIGKKKKNHSIIPLHPNCIGLRMDLYIIPKNVSFITDKSVYQNLIGGSPFYNICCCFYPNNEKVFSWYIATDNYCKN